LAPLSVSYSVIDVVEMVRYPRQKRWAPDLSTESSLHRIVSMLVQQISSPAVWYLVNLDKATLALEQATLIRPQL